MIWKLEFWKLFEDWSFQNLIWKLEFWKLNLEIEVLKIGILDNYLKMEVLEIKFENRNFGQLFEKGIFLKKLKF